MFKIGEKAWYRGAWGSEPARLCTITGEGEKRGRVVYDCQLESGATHWGYSDQFARNVYNPIFGRDMPELPRGAFRFN